MGELVALNDDWEDDPIRPPISLRSALLPPTRVKAPFRPQSRPVHTRAVVEGKGTNTGVALVEVYVVK